MSSNPPLSHLRFPLAASRGRRYPQPAHPYRSEFQRDRDRIVHCRAFRRLEDKTQVFGERHPVHFRNRLTHTIEVVQLARTAASTLGLDEDLSEALALVHDIGHPPFGHAGEHALDACMRQHGLRFNHNMHALRVVEHLEQRYASFPGLNLSFEVREGIVKHSLDFSAADFPSLTEYLPGLKPPIEAQLIDLADEAAYNTADLDDGYEARLISFDDVADAAPACKQIRESVETQFPGAPERARFHEFLRRLIDLLASGLIEGTRAAAIESGAGTWEDVRKLPHRLAAFTPEAAETSRLLKRFLLARVYESSELAEERQRSVALIKQLFPLLMTEPDRIPEPYHRDDVPLAQCVCDAIASMSDRQILRFATLS